MAGSTVTTKAKNNMVMARSGDVQLAIIEGMAFGDGGVDSNDRVKPHSEDQNALHHELLRKKVDGHTVISDTAVRYYCTLEKDELAGKYISEVGLYDTNGNMVAMKAFLKKGKDDDVPTTYECDDTF